MKEKLSSMPSKNNFYRISYPKMLRLLVLMTLICLALLTGIGLRILYPHQAEYYRILPGNQNDPMLVLESPIVSKGEILRWASQAVITVYNFDFNNWQMRIQDASGLFTTNGFTRFQDALKLDGVLTGIVEQKLQVTAVVTDAPVIIAEGYLAGRYTWKVNMPVLLTYTSSSEVRQRSILVTMLIARIPVLDSPRGYAIEQFYEESV